MAQRLFSVIFGCLLLFFMYYTFKLFIFWFLKKVLKLKQFKDRKFKIFGEEL